jgi:inosose dehydratase
MLASCGMVGLAALCGSSFSSFLTAEAFAAPGRRRANRMQIGYASITWGGNDVQAMEDIAALGYPGIQLRANTLKEFPDPKQLAAKLAAQKLSFVALSSGLVEIDPAKEKETIETNVAHAKYLAEAGGKYLQLIATFRDQSTATNADLLRLARLMTEIGRQAAAVGVQAGFHNHMGAIGQTPAAVDTIMAAVDTKYVKLLLDTAHYFQGGGDPAEAIRKYRRELLFLHLKDVTPATNRTGYRFVELGQGKLNFPAVIAALREIKFEGWGVIELDGPTPGRTPKESAAVSKAYLEKLGVRV